MRSNNWDWKISQTIRFVRLDDGALLDGMAVFMMPEADNLKVPHNYWIEAFVDRLKTHVNQHWDKACWPRTCFKWCNHQDFKKAEIPNFVRELINKSQQRKLRQ